MSFLTSMRLVVGVSLMSNSASSTSLMRCLCSAGFSQRGRLQCERLLQLPAHFCQAKKSMVDHRDDAKKPSASCLATAVTRAGTTLLAKVERSGRGFVPFGAEPEAAVVIVIQSLPASGVRSSRKRSIRTPPGLRALFDPHPDRHRDHHQVFSERDEPQWHAAAAADARAL